MSKQGRSQEEEEDCGAGLLVLSPQASLSVQARLGARLLQVAGLGGPVHRQRRSHGAAAAHQLQLLVSVLH